MRGKHVWGNSRHATCEAHGRARLNREQVKEIRALAGTMSQRELARRYGVSRGAIVQIINRRTWRFV